MVRSARIKITTPKILSILGYQATAGGRFYINIEVNLSEEKEVHAIIIGWLCNCCIVDIYLILVFTINLCTTETFSLMVEFITYLGQNLL
jgi:hypothetical protein